MSDDELILKLENGTPSIKTWGLSTKINYSKEVILKGMSGPKTTMVKTEVSRTGFTNTMLAINPSPLEIDLGTLQQEIRNSKGEKLAEQKGKVYFGRGETSYVMSGTTTGVPVGEGEARVLGLGVEEDNWNNFTMVHFNTATTLMEEFVALCGASGQTE